MEIEHAPFWEHVSALRNTLLWTLLVVVLGTIGALYFYREVFALLTAPLHSQQQSVFERQEIRRHRIVNSDSSPQLYTVPADSGSPALLSHGTQQIAPSSYLIPAGGYLEFNQIIPTESLIALSPLDGISASVKTSFWVGLVGTSPIWLAFLLQFVWPALRPQEKWLIFPFLLLSFLFLGTGLLFAFFVTIPMANHYLKAFNQGIASNFWTLAHYMDYTVSLLLANAFAFEIFVVLLFLVHLGIVSATTMIQKRRHVIVGAFIVGAVLTPPDILTQLMLALPLIALYECAILYARLRANSTN